MTNQPIAHAYPVGSRPTVLLLFTFLLCASASPARAQDPLACNLGSVKERVPAQYPVQLQGRIVEGTVQLVATFAPDGHVTSTRVLSGAPPLRFAAESYVRGWRAEKSDTPRQCSLSVDFHFDGSQGACNARTEVHARAEHVDDTHILVHLSCDIW